MDIVRERKAGTRRIGELLVAANIVKPEILLEALQVAKKSQTPLGRVLMGIGELNERDLQMAIEVQSLLKDNLISIEFGVRALNIAIKGCMPLEEAFGRLGWQPPPPETAVGNELGDLLMEAGVVNRKVLDEALRQSQENNLPLGRCLVLSRALSSSLLTSALTAQVLLRDGKISRDDAIEGLKAASRKRQTIEMSLQETGAYRLPKERMRLGDLLMSAGLLTEGDKISAIEAGLVQGQPVGQVLVDSGMISQEVLDQSLKLQSMVWNGELNGTQAADILKQAYNRKVPIEEILEEKSSNKDEIARANSLIDFLQSAGIVTGADMEKASAMSQRLNVSVGEVLVNSGALDKLFLQSALQARDLAFDSILRSDQVSKLLQHCKNSQVSFAEALEAVPWDVPCSSRKKADERKGGSRENSSKENSPKENSWISKLWLKVSAR